MACLPDAQGFQLRGSCCELSLVNLFYHCFFLIRTPMTVWCVCLWPWACMRLCVCCDLGVHRVFSSVGMRMVCAKVPEDLLISVVVVCVTCTNTCELTIEQRRRQPVRGLTGSRRHPKGGLECVKHTMCHIPTQTATHDPQPTLANSTHRSLAISVCSYILCTSFWSRQTSR